MASISETLRTIILDDATVSGKVGSRVVPDVLAQSEAIPAVVYRKQYTQHYRTLAGSKAGMAVATFELMSFADTRIAADELANDVRLSLLDAKGTIGGIDIRDVTMSEGESYLVEQNTEGSHELRYANYIECEIHYREAV